MLNGVLNLVNTRGIPSMQNVGTSLTDTAETFSFPNHRFVNDYFQGFFVVRIVGTNEAPADAVPINFTTEGLPNSNKPVFDVKGTAITTANWPGDGVYLMFYDRTTDVLRLMTTGI